jgi:hypothetical protein
MTHQRPKEQGEAEQDSKVKDKRVIGLEEAGRISELTPYTRIHATLGYPLAVTPVITCDCSASEAGRGPSRSRCRLGESTGHVHELNHSAHL